MAMNQWRAVTRWAPWRSPVFKCAILTGALGIWGFGLVEHLYESAGTMKYLLMSLMMVAVVVI